jgi:Alginate export
MKIGPWGMSLLCWTASVMADEPSRPVPLFNRWQEDWSVLANPAVPREPVDEYISLSQDDPATYLSLGASLRERFELNNAAGFATGTNRSDSYPISRIEINADLRVANQVQVFEQLQSDFAPGKEPLTPVDQDRLDIEQVFVGLTEPLTGHTFKLRVGRQQFAFDLQRFVSVRDGPKCANRMMPRGSTTNGGNGASITSRAGSRSGALRLTTAVHDCALRWNSCRTPTHAELLDISVPLSLHPRRRSFFKRCRR